MRLILDIPADIAADWGVSEQAMGARVKADLAVQY
jgi:hypothetical protein